jgi:hypothetical protein
MRAQRLNSELFECEYQTRMAAHRFKRWLYELRASEGVYTLYSFAELGCKPS